MAKAWISGIYPRSEKLIEATRKHDKNLPNMFNEEKRKIIRLQVESGLDYVSDPLIDWDDMLRPFTDGMKGTSRGALDRFYENNIFYRQPIISDQLDTSGTILEDSIALNLFSKRRKWKIDVLDPYSMADLAKDRFYGDKEKLMFAFASVIARELSVMSKDSPALVQFNAPSLARLRDTDLISQAKEAIRVITRKLKANTCLHLYFGDVSPTLDQFLDFGVDIIGIDFIRTEIESIAGTSLTKGLACGFVDAQNTKLETPREIFDFTMKAKELLDPRSIAIIPNCDLEFVPQPFAKRKVTNIGKAAKIARRNGI